ncbi:Uma2 family endonuclease [Calothrix sp. FACHB-1219]|uniref:Uma2 family endonuclease n=1 Tax=unclassified Calothrix TaxID=2619626 RepID=UPI001686C906|nr:MULTISPECIES: Uma2 family endonuclease [unclassified Calothrix]MBD2201354.1 Uma2 family endonuclease [Calothrix sp. FACHB-168]MBD2215788.1 Uma2 family endonuclease [Calothrix sp. FACHB-1219]
MVREYSPPLQSGDRLTRPEFERRYAAAPHIKKAELIEGIVYIASPLGHEQHGKPHSRIMTWLGIYQAMTPGVDLSDAPTVRLDLDNEPQPDAVLFLESAVGGQTRVSSDDYIEGAPELIVEIAARSAAIDRGSKKQVYRRNGVLEYVIWQTYDNQIEWFYLTDGDYQLLSPGADGIIRSQVFPGLWLAVEALLNNQMAQVLEVVQAGLNSAEHTAFVQQLSQRR